jgi:hypothetical protein
VQVSQSQRAGSANVVVSAGRNGTMFVKTGRIANETVLVVFSFLAGRLGSFFRGCVVFEGVEGGMDGDEKGGTIGTSLELFGGPACKVGGFAGGAAASSAFGAGVVWSAGFGAHGFG